MTMDDDDDAHRRAPVPRTLTHTTRLARSSVDPDPPPSTLVPRTVPIASLGAVRRRALSRPTEERNDRGRDRGNARVEGVT